MSCVILSLLLTLAAQDNTPVETGRCRDPKLQVSKDTPDEIRTMLRWYEIEDADFEWILKPFSGDASVEIFELTFPSGRPSGIEQNDRVCGKYFKPKSAGRYPGVVALHWLGGRFDILESICKELAEDDLAMLMLWMPFYGKRRPKDWKPLSEMVSEDLEQTQQRFMQAVVDIRRAGDWLASRPEVDRDRVGILGISLGAIVGSLAAGIDTRFARTCFVIGGGDLPEIVWTPSREMRKVKGALIEAGYTKEKLRELWRPIEPLTFAGRIRRDECLLLNAREDEVIPRSSTEKLWEAVGRPTLRWHKGTHTSFAVTFPLLMKTIKEHFKKSVGY